MHLRTAGLAVGSGDIVLDFRAVETAPPKYRRVLLKLSGEALGGESSFGIEPERLRSVAREISPVVDLGVQIALVIGAGNIFRGASLVAGGTERVTADQIGMLGTLMNALALQDSLERDGMTARVMSGISINALCEDYIRRRAIRHLDKGRVVILGAGTGNPFFTTDTAASLRAIEIEADLLIKATKVDGVFSADPKLDPTARRYRRLGYERVLRSRLEVMDATAIVLCREHQMPLRVIDMNSRESVLRTVMGEDEGTLVEDVPIGEESVI